MAKAKSSEPGVIAPGQTQKFIYVGNMIPAQLIVTNTDQKNQASYRLSGGETGGWTLFGVLAPASSVSLLLQWPSGRGQVNNSSAKADLYVHGNGFRPQ
ncbi:MAG TPA: hypothetical protein VHZ78_05705 [Rhizomicrobium sp.]|nr:hypothetical protein [Rhizomicrobium sp.]